ncbi:MAG: hypothetical protein R3A51_10440 [Nannocystaceae bacterium]
MKYARSTDSLAGIATRELIRKGENNDRRVTRSPASAMPMKRQIDNCHAALSEYADAIDGLASSSDVTSLDDIEGAVSLLASALEDVVEKYQLYCDARWVWRRSIEELPEEGLEIDSRAAKQNLSKVKGAMEEVEKIKKEMPSDGEIQDDKLEDLSSIVYDLYYSLENVELE